MHPQQFIFDLEGSCPLPESAKIATSNLGAVKNMTFNLLPFRADPVHLKKIQENFNIS